MSTITREFTKEQVVGHIRAKLDAHQNSTWPVSMASKAQMEKQILESALAAMTAPPAPVSVPDDVLNRLEHEAKHVTDWHHMDEHSCKVNRRDLLTLVNACREAMLQGADGNSPDGWVACSGRMPETIGGGGAKANDKGQCGSSKATYRRNSRAAR